MHYFSGSARHFLQHGAWVQSIGVLTERPLARASIFIPMRSYHRFSRLLLSSENQTWSAHDGAFEHLIRSGAAFDAGDTVVTHPEAIQRL